MVSGDAVPRTSSPVMASTSSSPTAAPPRPSPLSESVPSSRIESVRSYRPGSRRGSPFRARSSKLELDRLVADKEEFRGFFVLFWVAMGFNLVLTVINNLQTQGIVFGLNTFRLMTTNFYHFVQIDMKIIASLFVSLILALLQRWHIVRYPIVHKVLMHSYQTVFLLGWLTWIYQHNLPWIQSGSLTLHIIAMLFKIHSYNASNGDLNIAYWEEVALRKELEVLERADPDGTVTADRIAAIKEELAEIEEILCPNGDVRYPNNVTLGNFIDYLLVPTLVYEIGYPRTARIRWAYVAEKVVALAGIILLMYVTVEHYIVPVLEDIHRLTFAGVLLNLMFPFLIIYLLIFYAVFECVCNGFAELTRFADRNFFDDWYNSSSFDQFARKWNKPVHEFLLRHVYLESLNTYKVSKRNATFLTFLFSSCLHEVAMITVSRKFRMYLFVLQMLQLPLIWLGRQPWSRRHPVLGNAFFWFGMILGIPLLATCYCCPFFIFSCFRPP
ncbi:MBOAT, membrane-bound O-acyltransferase family-domain-containing protein [Blastocladiella britannica]|nr:MBOAT, membrane-bound O-acyltransferase family-domain-containing protein [Blastocladiella britannica]